MSVSLARIMHRWIHNHKQGDSMFGFNKGGDGGGGDDNGQAPPDSGNGGGDPQQQQIPSMPPLRTFKMTFSDGTTEVLSGHSGGCNDAGAITIADFVFVREFQSLSTHAKYSFAPGTWTRFEEVVTARSSRLLV